MNKPRGFIAEGVSGEGSGADAENTTMKLESPRLKT